MRHNPRKPGAVKMIKKLFIDLETTGIDPVNNGIHQISGVLEIDDREVMHFDYDVDIFPQDMIDTRAMDVSGKTVEQIHDSPPPKEILDRIFSNTGLGKYVNKFQRNDKAFFIGYNSGFDNRFLRSWFNKLGDNYFGSWFWPNQIDVMSLASEYLLERRPEMRNFQLATVAEELGIVVDNDKTHDSFYDIELTIDIYKKVRK